MTNPWELKTDDNRTSDSIYTFIIFCEDEHSEPLYFEWFETSTLKVNAIRNQKSNFKNITNAINKCVQNGILEKDINGYVYSKEGIEIWCVFDRDKSNIEKNDIEFNLAISSAEDNSLKVAWSNDSFELWILLHFFDITNNLEDAKERAYYYSMLTNYFSNHPAPNEQLKKVISNPHIQLEYKFHLKSERNFKSIVLPEILPLTTIAIERAKMIFDMHNSEVDFSKKVPCTLIYQLVERLLQVGQKTI